jgi:V/A-type H+/Na+-transporting ATPase subunit I
MIVKMKKYTFLVFHAEYTSFLNKIRDMGVLHIETSAIKTTDQDRLTDNMQLLRRLNVAIHALSKRKTQNAHKRVFNSPIQVLDAFDSLVESAQQIEQSKQRIIKDIITVEPWGVFSNERLVKLRDAGYRVSLFMCSASKYNPEWEKLYNAFIVGSHGSHLRFITVTPVNDLVQIDAELIKMPQYSVVELKKQLEENNHSHHKIEEELNELAKNGLMFLQEKAVIVNEEIEFKRVLQNSISGAEGAVMVLEGWLPKDKCHDLDKALALEGIYSEQREPTMTDNVPVLLKNNRFSRLFEVISDLYSKPNYHELDLTPYFAPFYLLFFGFCFSDAGYGLIFLLVATFLKIKKPKGERSIHTLVQLMGGSTMLFGFLGGTFLGIELYKTGLPVYSSIAEMYNTTERDIGQLVQDLMFKGSLALGAIQILFGMFLRAVKITRQKGFMYAISTLSWAFLIIVSGINYAYTNAKGLEFLNLPYIVLGGLFLVGIFFMNSPGKNLLLNFGIGLWDAYNTVVGGVGDLLSYVRLFALGLASSILGLVFNELGSQMVDFDSGIVSIIIGIFGMTVVLLAGHAINIFMSGLGSMVHPLRLTFVEFYKNAGFEGGGKAYNPFKKTINK